MKAALLEHVPPEVGEPAASALMQPDVLVFDAAATVAQVWETMRRTQRTHAVVMYDGTYLGVVDVNKMCLARFLELPPVSRWVLPLVVSTPTVLPSAGLREVCMALLSAPLDVVVVLDDEGGLHGLVSPRDIVSLIACAELSGSGEPTVEERNQTCLGTPARTGAGATGS